jgi:formylglycine-generating enzyme required for sulfatase activity
MVFVPAGEFIMGDDQSFYSKEKPAHKVYLDDFWIDKLEVTNALYKRCVDARRCTAPSKIGSFTRDSYYGNAQFANFPVIWVSWDDANAYCAWAGKKLPTEAQWEKAARGADARAYPWGNAFDKDKLNSSEGGKEDTTAVGSYPTGASPYGALDMAGNVWEWVTDWYDKNYYSNSPARNPRGPTNGTYRVVRGGAFDYFAIAYYNRAAFRNGIFEQTGHYFVVGFRCAQ